MTPEIRQRRLKYKGGSQLSKIFKNRDVLIERPEGMKFEDFHELRKIQTKILKELIKGPNNKTLERLIRPKELTLHQQNQILEAKIKREYELGIRWDETPESLSWFALFIQWLRNRFI